MSLKSKIKPPVPPPKYQKKQYQGFLRTVLKIMFVYLIFHTGIMMGILISYDYLKAPNFVQEKPLNMNSNNATVVFTKEVMTVLNILFTSHDTEWAVCLDGEIKKGIYYIDHVRSTKILETTENKVIHNNCPLKSLINYHNHPSGRCYLSNTDKKTYRKYIRIKPYLLTGIHCGVDRLSIYQYNDLENSLKWSIQE